MTYVTPERIGGIDPRESAATRRALDAINADAQAHQQKAQYLRESFAQAMQGDLSAPAPFAWNLKWLDGADAADVLADALDSKDFLKRAMAILVNAANGRGTQRDAQQLLAEVGAHWADVWSEA